MLVVVMGVMLVIGFVALLAVIAGRVAKKTPETSATATFQAAPIELPRGAHIEAMAVGPDRMVIDVLLPDGARQLVVIELATGRQLGTIPLRTAP
jgi:hypothetical protein